MKKDEIVLKLRLIADDETAATEHRIEALRTIAEVENMGGPDDVLTVADIARITPFGEGAIREGLKARRLWGRNIGGSVGWITTRADVTRWVRGEPARQDGAT